MSKNSTKKFAFFGTPALSVEILEEMKSAKRLPAVIVTAPDKPVGRSLAITPPPVKVWAEKNEIPVLQPERLDEAFLEVFKRFAPDFSIVVAYGKILPTNVLASAPLGFFNVHYSLLPRWRGATPVESAILSGDAETGVSIQKIVPEVDAGDVIALEKTPIGPDETGLELRQRLNDLAKKLLIKSLARIENGVTESAKQNADGVTLCKKIKKEDGLIDPSGDDLENYRKYRAYFGWPGVYFFANKGGKKIRVNIKKASFSEGRFVIEKVVPEGKKEMRYEVWRKNQISS